MAHAERCHRARSADLGGYGILEHLELFRIDGCYTQLDIGYALAQVKGRGLPSESVGSDGSQEVLGRVLLHVVEPASPVEFDRDGTGLDWISEHMSDLPFNLLDIDHRDAGNRPTIRRLPASLRVQDRISQNCERSSVLNSAFHHGGFQMGQARSAFIGGKSDQWSTR
jgi:hypothetical protein